MKPCIILVLYKFHLDNKVKFCKAMLPERYWRWTIISSENFVLFWQAENFIGCERIDFLCLKCLAIRFHIMQNRVNKLGRTLNWTFLLLPCVTIVYVCLSHTLESTSLDIPCDCLCIESGINFSCVHHFC